MIAVKDGPVAAAVKFPNSVFAAALVSENVSAGVVVAVATLVVNSGVKVPALKLVTVPLPDAVALMVWLGHVPVMLAMLVPATSPGVAVPDPPFATGRSPVTPPAPDAARLMAAGKGRVPVPTVAS